MDERPLKKKRSLDLGEDLPLYNPTSNTRLSLTTTTLGTMKHQSHSVMSSNLIILHKQQKIETLQSELDHERSARALDAKKASHSRVRLEEQLALAEKDALVARELLTETVDETERHIRQLSAAREKALSLNRQLQLQLEEAQQDIENAEQNSELEHYKIQCHRLQDQVNAQAEVEESNQRIIRELKESLQEQLVQCRAQTVAATEKLQNHQQREFEDAPQAVMQELHRCRMQLAERERQTRQLQRQVDSMETRSRELLQDCEKSNIQALRLPSIEAELRKLSASYEQEHAELTVWKNFFNQLLTVLSLDKERDTSRGPPEPTALIRHFENIKSELKLAQHAAAKFKAEYDRLRSEALIGAPLDSFKKNEENSAVWMLKERELEIKLETSSQHLQMAKQQAVLYQRESDSLRQLIRTFELQLKDDAKEIDTTPHALPIRLECATEQVALLESKHAETLTKLQLSQSEVAALSAELDRVRVKFGKLRDALLVEKEKVWAAEERAIKAEQLAGKGSFDPAQTRVLHMTETPLIETLKEQVQVLQRQLESPSSKVGVGTPGSDIIAGGVANPDKLNQRLKENFKEQIAIFREAVYLMTGFKVDMLTNLDRPTFRLRSVFAEQEEDQLLLQWPKNKIKDDATSLDILQTDLGKLLSTTPSYEYMAKFHSLPAFLSSVQLSLFEKQTVLL